ncbi:Cytochrome b5 [Morella rubra]|uniref:Cytochrome b5 n=1 Tax=Morella rubra TaxID=262757 RepID=A0A6A1W3C5_9ROSI|nr:Cytochrome b5 [Morella rubra]
MISVYDVTSFLEDHPGGDDVLVSATEKDSTDEFEFVGHSDSAKELMKKYYIGDIEIPVAPVKNAQTQPSQQNQSSGSAMKILLFLVPLLILGLAFALQYFGKRG